MKKIYAALGIIACLTCSGCSLLGTTYPEEYTSLVIEKADEYIEETYAPIFGDRELECLGFSRTGLSTDDITVVTYRLDSTYTFHVWNSLTYPIDDIAYTLYVSEAGNTVKSLAEEIFGSKIELETTDIGYFVHSTDSTCSDVNEFLSRDNSYMFLIAVAGEIPDKAKLVEHFCDRLKGQDINASFGIYFYEDYSEMLKDFQADKAISGRGDFADWVFCQNCNQEVELRGKGISYRQSSK